MKTTKEKADELVKSHLQALIDNHNWDAKITDGLKCAILSVKHTIEVLEKLSEATKIQNLYESNTCDAINQQNLYESNTCDAINQQTDLLSELESRL